MLGVLDVVVLSHASLSIAWCGTGDLCCCVVCKEIAQRINTIVLATQLTILTVIVQLTTFSPTPFGCSNRQVRTTMYVVILVVRRKARPSPSNTPAHKNNISACHTTHITTIQSTKSDHRRRYHSCCSPTAIVMTGRYDRLQPIATVGV